MKVLGFIKALVDSSKAFLFCLFIFVTKICLLLYS
nr:MAG TPA: hypothetical protein [Caudoviricetes sp.]